LYYTDVRGAGGKEDSHEGKNENIWGD